MQMVVDQSIKFNTCRNSSESSSGVELNLSAEKQENFVDKREEQSHLALNKEKLVQIELIHSK